MLQSVITQAGAVAIAIVCLYAMVMGGWREKFGALIYVCAYLLTIGSGLISIEHKAWYLLMADILCLQGFFVLSWRAPHPWPRFAVAAQLICVLAAVLSLLNMGLDGRAYLLVETAGGWFVLLSLLIGAVAAADTRRAAKLAA